MPPVQEGGLHPAQHPLHGITCLRLILLPRLTRSPHAHGYLGEQLGTLPQAEAIVIYFRMVQNPVRQGAETPFLPAVRNVDAGHHRREPALQGLQKAHQLRTVPVAERACHIVHTAEAHLLRRELLLRHGQTIPAARACSRAVVNGGKAFGTNRHGLFYSANASENEVETASTPARCLRAPFPSGFPCATFIMPKL